MTTSSAAEDSAQVALIYERDVPVPTRDGTRLHANVYRPADGSPAPVIMSFSPYGKDRSLAVRSPKHFDALGQGVFLNWETPDPEFWVPRGYTLVRVDARGAAASAGHLDPFAAKTAEDYVDAIEWAGAQRWSTGKVGLLGISYYGLSQWAAAARKPKYLTAMIPWEGAADSYRDIHRHGGILNNVFLSGWWKGVSSTQNGAGSTTDAELTAHRTSPIDEGHDHLLDDERFTSWIPDLSTIDVPFLSVGNWGNLGMHLRGNTEAFTGAGSEHKWLRLIEGDHIFPFYAPEALALQEQFLGYWLKGDDTGWMDEPRVAVALRADGDSTVRTSSTWPLAETQWEVLHLDAHTKTLRASAPTDDASAAFQAGSAPSDRVQFSTGALQQPLRIAGPVELRMTVSSSTTDADLFIRLRVLRPDGSERWGIGADGEDTALALGWLRASQRRLDTSRSTTGRPFHSHDRIEPLMPGVPVALAIEIWPTSIDVAAGCELIVEVRGTDPEGTHFRHNDPVDRPADIFGGRTTIWTGPDQVNELIIPTIS
ncbi:hypothetical protein NS330_03120 [Curtobacterium citreum]|nr:hypothetical protein NS330_03120 [Curtobacterium citreum]